LPTPFVTQFLSYMIWRKMLLKTVKMLKSKFPDPFTHL
jgi:hypothetical protein